MKMTFRTTLARGALAFALACSVALDADARQVTAGASASSLVFDGVTVVDVEHGKLVLDRRVVITGNRIQAVGAVGKTEIPKGAKVVKASGKYLIPGLWDMHVHPAYETDVVYPLLVAYGVTGIRDAGSPVPLDTLRRWRQQILAGTRVGPPRQLLSGQSLFGPQADCDRSTPHLRGSNSTCVTDSADAVHFVDSLKAAGADMLKPREPTREIWLALAAEARRVKLPFGGHVVERMTALEQSDRGATILDHDWGDGDCAYVTGHARLEPMAADLARSSSGAGDSAAMLELLREYGAFLPAKNKGLKSGDPQLLACWKAAAARFRRNGTWLVPTLVVGVNAGPAHVLENFHLGLPLLAGTDDGVHGLAGGKGLMIRPFGADLHKELALYVAHGLTPLEALQTATLNPAKMLHATDSLGTVAAGKLADLVLLDADPLADIANAKAIRAVVANGRYYDRAALDALAAPAQVLTAPAGKAP